MFTAMNYIHEKLRGLAGKAIRLVLVPVFMPHLAFYHLMEVMWNGPNATGFWWKVGVFIQGEEET